MGYRLSGVSQTWRCVSGRAVCHRPGGVSQTGRCVTSWAVDRKGERRVKEAWEGETDIAEREMRVNEAWEG